jgi:hypothetical protein
MQGGTTLSATPVVTIPGTYTLNFMPTAGGGTVELKITAYNPSSSAAQSITISGIWVQRFIVSPTNVDFVKSNTEKFPYGYNGQLKVNEVAGVGNWNTAEFWEYDTRLGIRKNKDDWNHDPSTSPNASFGDNPIMNKDPFGNIFVDAKGRKALSMDKNGNIHYTKYVTPDIACFVEALGFTETAQLKRMDASDIKVKVKITQESKIEKKSNGSYNTYGETIQGNYNKKDDYGRKVNPDGTFGIKEATIIIYEGTLVEDVINKNSKFDGLTLDTKNRCSCRT